jgi:hypothetical protein
MQNQAGNLKEINDKLYNEMQSGNYSECVKLLQLRKPVLKQVTETFSALKTSEIPQDILTEITRMKMQDPILMVELELQMAEIGKKKANNKIRNIEKHDGGYCINRRA